METKQTCNWLGQSGTSYTYQVWSLPQTFDPNQNGNYIYSKLSADNKWVPIYIGQGDLGDRIGPNHHAATCINSKGATHVHVHLNGRVEDRTAEESELLARYTNAYKPNGCNDKIGG